jgi:hypothetical protein
LAVVAPLEPLVLLLYRPEELVDRQDMAAEVLAEQQAQDWRVACMAAAVVAVGVIMVVARLVRLVLLFLNGDQHDCTKLFDGQRIHQCGGQHLFVGWRHQHMATTSKPFNACASHDNGFGLGLGFRNY